MEYGKEKSEKKKKLVGNGILLYIVSKLIKTVQNKSLIFHRNWDINI